MNISRRQLLVGSSFLVMAGCGGGGSDSSTPPPTQTPAPTPTPTVAVKIPTSVTQVVQDEEAKFAARVHADWTGNGVSALGFARLPLHAGAQRAWVDSVKGNDSNDGRTAATAKATLAAGLTLIREGAGDQLMVASGSEFQDGIGNLRFKSGLSRANPTVFQSYDRNDPTNENLYGQHQVPIWRGGKAAGGASGPFFHVTGQNVANYIVIRGFKVDAPDAPAQSASLTAGINYLLVENVTFIHAQVNDQFNGDYNTAINPSAPNRVIEHIWRHCGFADQWSDISHAQGTFADNLDKVTVEDCIFLHCGWHTSRDEAGAGATIFKHAYYASTRTYNGVFRRNLVVDPSSHGAQLRGHWEAYDNVFSNCPIGLLLGGGDEYNVHQPAGVMSRAYRNIIVDSVDINSTTARRIGLDALNNQPGSFVKANLIVHSNGGMVNAYAFSAGAAFDQPTDIDFINNTVVDWGTGARGQSEFPARLAVTQENNVFQRQIVPGSVTGTEPTGSNISSVGRSFVDDARNSNSAASRLGYANITALARKALEEPAHRWAELVSDHIRAGFAPAAGQADLFSPGGVDKGAVTAAGAWVSVGP